MNRHTIRLIFYVILFSFFFFFRGGGAGAGDAGGGSWGLFFPCLGERLLIYIPPP